MPTGTIKKLVSDRGFGFIAAEDGKEYFFHRTGLDSSVNFDSLAGGARVSFEIDASPEGPRHAAARSNRLGRRAGSCKACADSTRDRRKSRRSPSTSAIRYQTPALMIRPRGSTSRSTT